MLRILIVVVVTVLAAGPALADVKTKLIKYHLGQHSFQGYLAWDDAVPGRRPGVLLIHEWWGLNDYARQRAEQLAKEGYVVFAADMYGEGKVAQHPKEAGEMATQVRSNVDDWRKRAAAALGVLKDQPQCAPDKLAAIGYCFGGSTALQLSYSGADLKAVVTFHASLPVASPEDAKRIKASILVCTGEKDPFIPAESVKAFRAALDQASVAYEVISYPDTLHSFTVADAGRHGIDAMKYNKHADEDSWKRMLALFEKKFGK